MKNEMIFKKHKEIEERKKDARGQAVLSEKQVLICKSAHLQVGFQLRYRCLEGRKFKKC